jgi:hypothetical protein
MDASDLYLVLAGPDPGGDLAAASPPGFAR